MRSSTVGASKLSNGYQSPATTLGCFLETVADAEATAAEEKQLEGVPQIRRWNQAPNDESLLSEPVLSLAAASKGGSATAATGSPLACLCKILTHCAH